MTTERDIHFQGFAKLLVQELIDQYIIVAHPKAIEGMRPDAEKIIAQRAYDLAYHFIESNYKHRGTFRGEIHMSVSMMPDLTEWPNTSEQST